VLGESTYDDPFAVTRPATTEVSVDDGNEDAVGAKDDNGSDGDQDDDARAALRSKIRQAEAELASVPSGRSGKSRRKKLRKRIQALRARLDARRDE
jgi:hypothetical protein